VVAFPYCVSLLLAEPGGVHLGDVLPIFAEDAGVIVSASRIGVWLLPDADWGDACRGRNMKSFEVTAEGEVVGGEFAVARPALTPL
jgi:hypothetical protein